MDLLLNNLLIISINFYSCTGSRPLDLVYKNFVTSLRGFYAKAQLFFHTPPIWINIIGIDEEYIVLNNSKRIILPVFSCLNAHYSQSSQQITFAAFNQQFYLLQLIGFFIFLTLSSAPSYRHANMPSTLSIFSNHYLHLITASVHPTLPKAWSVLPSSRKAAALQGPSTATTALLMG